jgi:hypothetical protein
MFLEQAFDQLVVEDGTLHEDRPSGHVLRETTAQVVQDDDPMPHAEQVFGHMRTDETCASGDK